MLFSYFDYSHGQAGGFVGAMALPNNNNNNDDYAFYSKYLG